MTNMKVIIIVFNLAILCCDSVRVSTGKGAIIGLDHLRSRHGKVIYSFTGVPYAQPPIGKLRFKEAQPLETWKVDLNATGPRPVCAQPIIFGEAKKGELNFIGQEDCLNLNIYTTSLNSSEKRPVMVFLHGGAYTFSSTRAEPEFLAEDVVLVDVGFRLNSLGFATTGDDVIPGNLGLKDVVLALKWTKEHIVRFGGDPNLVTVFGDSAGGAMTHLLLLSPLTRGLIHRGISMSGTAHCPWAMMPQQLAIDRTKALAVLCGCPHEPSNELIECLQEVPIRDLMEMYMKFQNAYGLPLTIFAPIVEEPSAKDPFLSSDPSYVQSEIPWITGIVSGEHLGYPIRFVSSVELKGLPLADEFDYFFSTWLHGFNIGRKQIPGVAQQIKNYYFEGRPINTENIANMDHMLADGWFLKGLVESLSTYKGKKYLYYYDYLQSNATFSSIYGHGLIKGRSVSHGDGLLNLFPVSSSFPNRSMSQSDLDASEKKIDLWTSFAKYGDPTSSKRTKTATINSTLWEPVEKNNTKNKYLEITAAGFTQKEDLLRDRVEFWKSLRISEMTHN